MFSLIFNWYPPFFPSPSYAPCGTTHPCFPLLQTPDKPLGAIILSFPGPDQHLELIFAHQHQSFQPCGSSKTLQFVDTSLARAGDGAWQPRCALRVAISPHQPHSRSGSCVCCVLCWAVGSHFTLGLRGACLCRARPLPCIPGELGVLARQRFSQTGRPRLCLPLFTLQGDEKQGIGTQ